MSAAKATSRLNDVIVVSWFLVYPFQIEERHINDDIIRQSKWTEKSYKRPPLNQKHLTDIYFILKYDAVNLLTISRLTSLTVKPI